MTQLGPADFNRLTGDAQALPLKDTKSYLAEALESLRHGGDPVETLTLLQNLWGTGYANSFDQKSALDAVGQWLEKRLQSDPGIPVERLRREVGWLRRMVMVQMARSKQETTDRGAPARDAPANHGGGRPGLADGARGRPGSPPAARSADGPKFGHRLPELRRRRELALKSPLAAPAPDPRAARPARREAPPRPTELPEVFAVTFADITDVRQARKKAKERLKDKKPPKDRLITLHAVESALASLAANIVCSLLATPGLDAVFEAMAAQGGIAPVFYVRRSDLAERDGKRVAQRISLTPPEAGPGE